MASDARSALSDIWRSAGLAETALPEVQLDDEASILASSFNVGLAAQASTAAAAAAAVAIHLRRGGLAQDLSVSRAAAERECTGLFSVDGVTPEVWQKLAGLYPTGDGHVRVHTNFDHHRDGVLDLLGLPASAERDDVGRALQTWSAIDFETAAAERGLVVAAVRSFDEWDAHPHAHWTSGKPLLQITKIADAGDSTLPGPRTGERPLSGVRVLDLTRILAGPICGRTLAAYGAEVMLVNSPRLPNIAAIIDTSRGKRSTLLDLSADADVGVMDDLVRSADVFVQGYRPGGIAGLGFGPERLAELRPGIVSVSLSAYGDDGPWGGRRGFDSLVQTATGFNHAEGQAAGSASPKPMPVQILDYASGFLMAFGAQAAMLRRSEEGGSWHVEVSLLQTANWLRSLGRVPYPDARTTPELPSYLESYRCLEGELLAMPHGAALSETPAVWDQPAALPGAHPPTWST